MMEIPVFLDGFICFFAILLFLCLFFYGGLALV